MTKTLAWILFLSSVLCFVVQLTAQQVALAADDMRFAPIQPMAPTTQPTHVSDTFADVSGDAY